MPCGHEEWWNPFDIKTPGLYADSSWCALAFDLTGVRVWYQVRNPLKVVTSFCSRWSQNSPWWDLKKTILRGKPCEKRVDLAMQTVVDHHKAAMELNPERIWKLEEVSNELVEDLCSELDTRPADITLVSNNVNQHNPGRKVMTLDDLPDNKWKEPLAQMAESFSYL